ncbi:MAG: L,D-transpeptidase family protein [Alphaproteobacteria bacterium]
MRPQRCSKQSKPGLGALGLLLLLLVVSPAPEAAAAERGPLVGGRFEYTVAPGDFLIKIGARFGVDYRTIARESGIEVDATLHPGQKLTIDNRHIVPDGYGDGLILNLPQRMLYLIANGTVEAAYPVAVGRPDWPTPTGGFTVAAKEIDKTWIVPPSIQEEMRCTGRPVLTEVPPGPDNPLGRYWLGLSIPALGIHGTNAPASIYGFRSHGCIRLHPDDIAALFPHVALGTRGELVYRPLLIAAAGGRVFLEAHRDVYNKGGVSLDAARRLATERGLAERIDWALAETVIAREEGIARDVTAEGS